MRMLIPRLCLLCALLPAVAQAADGELPAGLESKLAAASDARNMGRLDDAATAAESALAAARNQGIPAAQARALRELGQIAMERNDYPLAMTHLRRAESILEGLDDPELLADVYNRIGMVYRYQTDYPAALEYIHRALAIYETTENLAQIGNQYNSIGVVVELTGRLEEALRWHQQSLAIDRETGDLSGTASSLYNIGEIFRDLGDLEDALTYFQDALDIDQQVGEPKNIAYSHHKVGTVYLQQGRLDAARPHVTRALELFRQIQAPRDTDWATSTLGELEMRAGNLDAAERLLTTALDRSVARESRSLVTNIRMLVAELELLRGNHPAALAQIDEGLAEAENQNETDKAARLLGLKARVLEDQGDFHGALEALRGQQIIEDMLVDRRRIETLATMQGSAEFARRGQQIASLQQQQASREAELERQRVRRNMWLGFVLAGFVILLLVQGRINQRRLNRQLTRTVADQTSELRKRQDELERAYGAVREAALTDQLTGLRNRRFLAQHIEADIERSLTDYRVWQDGEGARPTTSDLIFFLVDMDHFKSVNDRFGHAAGDQVLAQAPDVMRHVFRESDYLIRWGGEEFLVVARFVGRNQAMELAERLRTAIADHRFLIDNDEPLSLTCSIGYASMPFLPKDPEAVNWRTVIDIADFCLYAAKASGRNAWVGLEAVDDPLIKGNLQQSLARGLKQGRLVARSSLRDRAIVWFQD